MMGDVTSSARGETRALSVVKGAGIAALAIFVFLAINLVHASVRSFADDVSPISPINLAPIETALFGTVASEWLQSHAQATSIVDLSVLVWGSFFWIPLVLVATIGVKNGSHLLLRFLMFHAILVLASDLLYALVPARPPWMDADVIRFVATQSQDGGTRLDRNPYAAFPSLHVALPMAYAVWFAIGERPWMRRLRYGMFAWTAAVCWAVVYTGEHYILDVIGGVVWGVVVAFACQRLLTLEATDASAAEAEPASITRESRQAATTGREIAADEAA